MKLPYGLIVYFVRLVVPMNLLCFIVITFNINIASPTLNGFVLATQIFSSILSGNPFLIDVLSKSYTLTKFVADFYGLFNLDFFVHLIPSFCIHHGMNTTTVVALDIFTALYPMLFTVIVYMFISLHDRGCKVFVTCWKPFHKRLVGFRRNWNIKGSVLNSFCTFLLLSHGKICLASLNLTQPVRVWDKHGNLSLRLFFDAKHEFRPSGKYVMFFMFSTTICFVTILWPAFFVLFYQNKFFQKCLFFCRFKCRMIRELANITQGCFKNGISSGTRDYRWFAGLYMLLKIAIIIIVYQRYFHLICGPLFSIMAVMVAGFRPYKKTLPNVTDSVLWLVGSTGVFWHNYLKTYEIPQPTFIYIFFSFPFLCILFCVSGKLFIFLYTKCQAHCIRRRVQTRKNTTNESDLPHRLLNPNEYTPLVEPS